MKRNRRRQVFNEENETKKIIYISIITVILAIVAFIVTYIIYSNAINKKTTGDLSTKIVELSSKENTESSQVSSNMGKTINEVKEDETERIAINTSNMEKENQNTATKNEEIKNEGKKNAETKNIETKNTESNNSENITSSVIKDTSKENNTTIEKTPDPTFIKPVEGEITKEFAKDNLVYSDTLKEWITHNGIDIKAEKTTVVKASANGTVKSIKNDPRYGITVVIEHANGYVTIYSNLLTAEFVKEGERIEQGKTIGTVGNTAIFEIADEPHIHFELLKDNEYKNPSEYIK